MTKKATNKTKNILIIYFIIFILVSFHQAGQIGNWFENKARNSNIETISTFSFKMADIFHNTIFPLGGKQLNELESLIINHLNPDNYVYSEQHKKIETTKEKIVKPAQKAINNFSESFQILANVLLKLEGLEKKIKLIKTNFQTIENIIYKPKSILLIGDSMMLEGFGPQLQSKLMENENLIVNRDGRYGTGLCRLDVFDWLEYFDEMLDQYKPDLVIITLGANDPQDIIITVDKKRKRYFPATDDWNKLYEERVTSILERAKNKGAKVFWVGLPIMSKEPYNTRIKNINNVIELACSKSENGLFWDSWYSVANDKKEYSSYLTDENKKNIKIRGSDNIHLTKSGGIIMADKFLETTANWADYNYIPPDENTDKETIIEPITEIIKDKHEDIKNKSEEIKTKTTVSDFNLNIFQKQKLWANEKNFKDIQLYSNYRQKNTNYTIIKPLNNKNKKLPAIILLHGAWTDQKIWLENAEKTLKDFANKENIYIIMPDGDPFGWYVDSPFQAKSQIESYFIKEFLPDLTKNFNINEDKISLIGLSMGGHGSFNFAINYPNKFQSISSMSGALDITEHGDNRKINKSIKIHDVLGLYSENQDLWEKKSAYFQVKNNATKLKNIKIYLTVGLEDQLTLNENRKMSNLLNELGLEHQYYESSGAHDWAYWLSVLNNHLYFHQQVLK